MITLKKTEEQLTNELMGKISLQKDKDKFANNIVNLSKSIVNLSKEKQVDIGATSAQVVAVIDYSGSMVDYYENGDVQDAINLLIPLVLTFDDDGTLQSYKLHDSYERVQDLNLENYSGYIKEIFYKKNTLGGTRYSPVIRQIIKDYFNTDKGAKGFLKGLFSKKKDNQSEADIDPVFVLAITDGKPFDDDIKATYAAIREAAEHKMFIQFIGINKKPKEFELLEKLDDFKDRKCDNTGFVRFDSLKDMSDVALYNAVLSQYADWLKVQGY